MARFASQTLAFTDDYSGNVIGLFSSFSIYLNGAYRTFTCENNFSVDALGGTFLPDTIGYAQRTKVVNVLKNWIAANGGGYSVSPGVTIVGGVYNYLVKVTALDYGSAYDFLPMSTVSNSGSYLYEYAVVTNLDPPQVSATVTEGLCSSNTDGAIDLSVTGGVAPFTYDWTGPDGFTATTQDITEVPPGIYTVTVTDSDTVPGVTVFSAEITAPPVIAAVANISGKNIYLTVSGGTPGYTYAWTGPDSFTATTQNILNLADEGEYTCEIIDSNGCHKIITVTLALSRFYYSGNPIVLKLKATSPGMKPNLSFVCKVEVEKEFPNAIYTDAVELEVHADVNGAAEVNAQSILKEYLKPHVPIFSNGLEVAVSAFRRFRFSYAERYGSPPETQSFIVGTINRAFLGGLNFREYPANTFFNTYLPTQKPFLTWEPLVKQVFEDQPEYLYFIANGLATDVDVRVKVFFETGSPLEFSAGVYDNTELFLLLFLPVGYTQLNLKKKDLNRQVVKWEVWVKDLSSSALVTETRTFYLDRTYFRKKRYLLYQNSLGGRNTLALVGKATAELEVKSQQQAKVLLPDYAFIDGDTTVSNLTGTPTLKVSTGFRNREQMDRLQDFLLAAEGLLFDNGIWTPVTIKDKTHVPSKDDPDLMGYEVTLVLPRERFYTPILASPVPVTGNNSNLGEPLPADYEDEL